MSRGVRSTPTSSRGARGVSLPLRPARVHGVGEAENRTVLGLLCTSFGSAELAFFLGRKATDRDQASGEVTWCVWESPFYPQHPRALGVGRRSRGEQGERDDH